MEAGRASTGKVLAITGVSGFLGSRLASRALARGYRVRALSRREWDGAPGVPVGDRVTCDLPWILPAGALDGVWAVIHCAATDTMVEALSRAVNVDGTEVLARSARAAGVRAFVYVSSSSARADALSAYGRSKYEAESRLKSIERLAAVIIRPGLITGPGKRGVYRRMCGMVDRLPLIPLLGGGKSPVQPVNVDDLSDALIAAADGAAELSGRVLDLGSPEPVTLGDFLSELSLARRGHRIPRVPIPLLPVELAVALAERLGFKLPVSSSNLKGMKAGAPIDTGPGMAALGVPVRPLAELLRMGEGAAEKDPPAGMRAMRVLLVGAGKMGIIHCGNLARARGAVLCGMADPKAGAIGLLRGIGAGAPGYAELDSALAAARPDAAIVATPPHLHLPLAVKLAGRGLSCLVEKPLAPGRAGLAGYRAMAPADRDRLIPGYVMLHNPHVRSWLGRLKAGELGRPTGFAAFSLLSLADSGPVRGWMGVPEVSGGGALMNLGVHALSVVHGAFGKPGALDASLRGRKKGVDDSLVVDLDYGTFKGRLWTSWAISGYTRAEQSVYVWTDRGLLVLNGMAGWFLDGKGGLECVHQLDDRGAYNMAPDFSGAGFAGEVTELARQAREGGRTAGVGSALDFEDLVADIHDGAKEASAFDGGAVPGLPMAAPAAAAGAGCLVDARDLGRGPGPSVNCGVMAWPGQFPELERGAGSRDTVLVFPDFMSQSRMLAGGKVVALLRSMGAGGIMGAGFAALPRALAEKGATFWVAAEGLAAASLAGIPRDYCGTLVLNGYLTDLATTFERRDFIARMVARARRACPKARIGFHTGIPREAGRTLMEAGPVDCVCVLSSPSAVSAGDFAVVAGQAGAGAELIADPGPLPAPVAVRLGAGTDAWRHGARRIILPALAHPATAGLRADSLSTAWSAAFPGARLPGVLIGR